MLLISCFHWLPKYVWPPHDSWFIYHCKCLEVAVFENFGSHSITKIHQIIKKHVSLLKINNIIDRITQERLISLERIILKDTRSDCSLKWLSLTSFYCYYGSGDIKVLNVIGLLGPPHPVSLGKGKVFILKQLLTFVKHPDGVFFANGSSNRRKRCIVSAIKTDD